MPLHNKLKPLAGIALLCLLLASGLQAQQADTNLPKQLVRKLAPHLHDSRHATSPTSYRVQVKDKQAFYTWLQEHKLDLQVSEVAGQEKTFLISGIRPSQLSMLAASPVVRYVDKPNRKAVEELELKDTDFVTNNIYAAQAAFPTLTGQGMAVSVKENPFNPADIDLQGRVLAPQSFGGNHSMHATTMATIMAGAGNSGPGGKGVTWKSAIAYSDFAELYPDKSLELLQQGVTVQNHSYGVGVENYYGLESQAYDRETHQHPELLHIFSSGNSGDQAEKTGTYANLAGIANLTGQFKTSKNTLAVGALEPNGTVGIRSSGGPAYDGRIKPEVVAHGVGGTSEAAAVVSGIALLVQQAYKEKYGHVPPASLVKAAIINSAEDVGRPGPDFESGFGNADALGAIRSIAEQRFVHGSVVQGETQNFQIAIPAGVQLLKATIVWHEPEAEPNAETALLHDLDLSLHQNATGYTWLPWVLSTFPHPDSLRKPARRGHDRLNNVEQITLQTPPAGSYTLKVTGSQVGQGPQTFSLVYEYERGMEWLYPIANATLVAGQPNRVAWQGAPASGAGRLEYRVAGEKTWHLVTDQLNLSQHTSYTWEAPETAALAQLRLVTAQGEALSSQFMLVPPLALQVGFNCEEQVMLHWPKMPAAEQYQLSYLGSTHLESLLTTFDTLAVLDKRLLANGYVAIAPVIAGMQAQHSRSIAFNASTAGCYITSFLPQQLVMDTVKLDLQLSTLYQLATVTLERMEQGEFRPVQTLSPITQLQHRFIDDRPHKGMNVYRVKVSTAGDRTFYSRPEEVIHTRPDDMQVYPNPVAAGQPFFVAVSGDKVQVQLYDQLGRLVLETSQTGILKEIRTQGLTRGLYIVRLQTETGSHLLGKVLVL